MHLNQAKRQVNGLVNDDDDKISKRAKRVRHRLEKKEFAKKVTQGRNGFHVIWSSTEAERCKGECM